VWWWMSAVVDGEKRGLQDMCTLAAAGCHPDFPRQLHDTHCMNLAMVRNETIQCYFVHQWSMEFHKRGMMEEICGQPISPNSSGESATKGRSRGNRGNNIREQRNCSHFWPWKIKKLSGRRPGHLMATR